MNKTLLLSCLALACAPAFAASLLPPAGGDLSPSRLQAAPAPAFPVERQPVALAWAVDPSAELVAAAPHEAESREYWMLVDGAALKRGQGIDTTAPGALIRISPERDAAPVSGASLRVAKGGRVLADGFRSKADAGQLQAAGMDVPAGSVIVKLEAAHGAGRFDLQLAGAEGRYLVHVFEPQSPYVLKAQAASGRVLAGDTLEVAAQLRRGQAKLGGGTVEGELVSPAGTRYPLAFVDGKARLVAPAEAGALPGLWEVHVFAGAVADGQPVQREARTAVEVVLPTARLAGGYAFDARARRVDLPLQVAAPGRYEVRGTLYATSPSGELRPVAQAHSAAWLEAGQRSLSLPFASAPLPAGYGAPFELRHLELKDQARMGTLETRGLALREGPAALPGGRTPARRN